MHACLHYPRFVAADAGYLSSAVFVYAFYACVWQPAPSFFHITYVYILHFGMYEQTNSLTGSIPPSLGNLTKLTNFYVTVSMERTHGWKLSRMMQAYVGMLVCVYVGKYAYPCLFPYVCACISLSKCMAVCRPHPRTCILCDGEAGGGVSPK